MNFDKSCLSMGELKIDFLNFANHCVEKSQMCNYFENSLNMVEFLKDLVAAAGEGDTPERHICLLHKTFYQYSVNLAASVIYDMNRCIWWTSAVYLKNIQKNTQNVCKVILW